VTLKRRYASSSLKLVTSQEHHHRSHYLVNHESQRAAGCLVTRTRLQLLTAHYSLIFMPELFYSPKSKP